MPALRHKVKSDYITSSFELADISFGITKLRIYELTNLRTYKTSDVGGTIQKLLTVWGAIFT